MLLIKICFSFTFRKLKTYTKHHLRKKFAFIRVKEYFIERVKKKQQAKMQQLSIKNENYLQQENLFSSEEPSWPMDYLAPSAQFCDFMPTQSHYPYQHTKFPLQRNANHSINFFIYFITNFKFKKQFKEIFFECNKWL